MSHYELDNLPHPEEMEALELVGLYMQVYTEFVRVSRAITARITGNRTQDTYLSKVAVATEGPLDQWLTRANEFLPDWWDDALLNYPGDDKP